MSKTKNSNIKTLDQFKDKHYGKVGTAKRDELEIGYDSFKIGAMIHEAKKVIWSLQNNKLRKQKEMFSNQQLKKQKKMG